MAFSSLLGPVCDRLKVVIATHASVAAAQVHSTRRHFLDAASWEALHWDGGSDNLASGWEIDRIASPIEDFEGAVSNLNLRTHTLLITAFRAIWPQDPQTGTADTGRAAWRTIVEEVCDLIRRDMFTDVPFSVSGVQRPVDGAPVVTVDEHREIFGTMTHYIEIELSFVEMIVWP